MSTTHPLPETASPAEWIRDAQRERAAQVVDELRAFVAVANDVEDAAAIQRNANVLADMMRRRGITAELWNTPSGRPAVFGTLITDPLRPTLLLYGHFDGVPAPADGWHSDPYEAVLRPGVPADGEAWTPLDFPRDGVFQDDWRIFGRSTADSKGAIVAVLGALDVLRARGTAPGVNLKFLFDGEEERESPGLPRLIAENAAALRADLLISASGEVHQSGLPTLSFGVRGMLMLELSAHTADVEAHSGHFGGFAPNAGLALARLLASMRGDDGSIAVRGFEDGILPLGPAERQAIAAVPTVEAAVMARYGIRRRERAGTLQELINQPTLNIRGLQAGYVGRNARNSIPAVATAELDVRLVAGMDPDHVQARIAEHASERGWSVVEEERGTADPARDGPVLRVRRLAAFPAVRTPMDHPVGAAVLRTLRRVASRGLVVQPTEGGSLPFHYFATAGIPVVTLPIANYDCNQHSENENLRLGNLFAGVQLFASLFLWEAAEPAG